MMVVGSDEVENLDAGVGLGGEGTALEHFVLEGAHEESNPSIAIGIAACGLTLEGNDVIIGANAVVTKDVPANAIVVGANRNIP